MGFQYRVNGLIYEEATNVVIIWVDLSVYSYRCFSFHPWNEDITVPKASVLCYIEA